MTAQELTRKYRTLLNRYEINTPLRLAHFWGQLYAESKLKPIRESLYYTTISGLRATFKTPFKGKSDEFVSQYLRDTEKCANYVYANRGGNGNEASGDGFKFRGGGFIMVTFKDGYKKASLDTGIDFINDPNLITEEVNALISALNFWKNSNLNKLADEDNLDAISDIINIGSKTKTIGDSNGFKERKESLEKYKKIFK